MCVYSNSRNDVPQVAQRYGTIATHTRCRASVLIVFVVFCVHMHSFAGLIRRTPPSTFSDTAVTDRHSDTTIFQLRTHWVRISWSFGLEKSFGHVPRLESNPRLPACKASTLSTRPGSPLITDYKTTSPLIPEEVIRSPCCHQTGHACTCKPSSELLSNVQRKKKITRQVIAKMLANLLLSCIVR